MYVDVNLAKKHSESSRVHHQIDSLHGVRAGLVDGCGGNALFHLANGRRPAAK